MNPFSNWTQADAAAHNARVRGNPASPALGTPPEREADLHAQIEAECARRGWYILHSRMDCPTTTAKGVPDFVIAADGGKTYWIEAKGKKTKLTPKQNGALCWLRARGHVAEVVRSMEEFLKVVDSRAPIA